MIWFTIHNILKKFSHMKNQTKNLTTFLIGTFLYVLFYSYSEIFDSIEYSFLKRLFEFFIYIVIADGIVMAILYKQTIFTQANKTSEASGSKISSEYVKSSPNVNTNIHNSNKDENNNISIPLLSNESEYVDENEGFTKDSALGYAYSTNGNSNA